jgi:hypothetical protein
MFEAPRQIQSAAAGGANVAVDLPADSGIDVRQILAVLWRGKATIFWTIVASLLIAFLLVLVVPHRYTARFSSTCHRGRAMMRPFQRMRGPHE